MESRDRLEAKTSQDEFLQQMWQDAVAEYSAGLSDSDRQKRKTINVGNMAELEAELDKRNGQFDEFRSRRRKLFEVMKKTLQPLQLAGNIVAGGVSTVFAPASNIYAAVAFLLQAAGNVSKKYDTIIDMFDDLRILTAQLDILVRGPVAPELRTSLIRAMATTLKFIGLVEKAVTDGRTITFFKRAFQVDDPITECRTELQRKIGAVQQIVLSLGYNELRDSRRDADTARDFQEKTRKWRVLEKRLDVNLRMPDCLGDFMGTKLDDTCGWLREEPSYTNWTLGHTVMLWIFGGQGAGKTHLAADQISDFLSKSDEVAAAYYFCRKSSLSLDSAARILDTLTWQLAGQSVLFFESAVAVYDNPGNTYSSFELWRQLFDKWVKKGVDRQFVLLLDGLDEMDDAELDSLLGQMAWLAEISKEYAISAADPRPPIRITAFGRPSLNDTIDAHFDCEMVEVSAGKSAGDIAAYIKDKVEEWIRKRPEIKSLEDRILQSLEDGAAGSFLWVKLKIDELRRQSQLANIRKILERPPVQLGEELDNALNSLSRREADSETVNTILSFTVWFERPLTLGELSCVPNIEAQDHSEDVGFIGLDELLVSRYSPLYRLQRDDGFTEGSLRRQLVSSDFSWIDLPEEQLSRQGRGDRLRPPDTAPLRRRSPSSSSRRIAVAADAAVIFDHASFFEYFRTTDRKEINGVVLDRNTANFRIARFCLVLLTELTEESAVRQKIGDPIIAHAAHNFSLYLGRIDRSSLEESDQRHIAGLLLRLFGHRHTTRRWLRALATMTDRGRGKGDVSIIDKSLNDEVLEIGCSWIHAFSEPTRNPETQESSQKTTTNLLTRVTAIIWQLGSPIAKAIGVKPPENPINQIEAHQKAIACAVADEWLEDHGWVDETQSPTGLHALFLCNFIAKVEDPSSSEEVYNQLDFPMYPKAIRDAASWYLWDYYVGTARWHTCLALTYLGLKFRRSAIAECEKALALDPAAWHAMYVLSLAHMELNHREEALENGKMCAATWPQEMKWKKLHYRLLRHLSKCYLACGDAAEAHATMANAITERPGDLGAVEEYLLYVNNNLLDPDSPEKPRWDLLGHSISMLHASRSRDSRKSLMSELLNTLKGFNLQVHAIIQRALRHCGTLSLAIDIYRSAIEAAETDQKYQYVSILQFELGRVLFECNQSIEHPIRCIEQRLHLDNLPGLESETRASLYQQQAIYHGIRYLTRFQSAKLLRALESGDRAKQTHCYRRLDQLWTIARRVNTHIPIWLDFQRHCWYHYGLAAALTGDGAALRGFRTSGVWTALGLVRRPSPGSPGLGFRRLSYLCQISGNRDGVRAALAQWQIAEDAEVAARPPGATVGYDGWACDGPCEDKAAPWREGTGLYHCQVCLDTDWCHACLEKLGARRIPYSLCSSQHVFVHLKPFAKPEAGFVRVGDRTLRIDDWIYELAVAWDCPESLRQLIRPDDKDSSEGDA
ncbi:hypothetical protein F4778DRAFT_723667 [Xylariomycetidae sp. FL2044]|nr:hypothetical protein F4778DRAFT_723667 [Xylariomycetidae sp. FL2044]